MDNTQLAKLFLDHLTMRGFAVRTIETYQGKLTRFFEYLAAKQKTIQQFTAGDLEEYRTALYYQEYRGKPLSLETQLLQLTVLRMFFKFLADQNLILINPAASLELPKTTRNPPRVILTAREARKILESINIKDPFGLRDRAILEVLYSTGIRVTELAKITLADIDFESGLLWVDGKGGKERVVPIGEMACFYVKEYIKKARSKNPKYPNLFLSRWFERPIDRGTIATICTDRAMQAGIKKKVTTHTWRHTCATLMLKGGADIRYVQELLGHASLKTTQIYTRVAIGDLKKVHARCHPRDKEHF